MMIDARFERSDQDMRIKVTKHAIERYRERLCDYSSSNEQIIKVLSEIACKGRGIATRPSAYGQCMEIKCKGISIVLALNGDNAAILTCLGDNAYRKWVKHQSLPGFIRGRILFPGPDLCAKEN